MTYPTDSPFRGVKKVHYWAARSTGGEFTPGSEVDELIWLPVPDAMNKLDYAQDRKVLCRFAKHPADTQTVLVVRHGTAGSKAHFSGDDSKRPLDKRVVRRQKRWYHSCWRSAPPMFMPPTGCAATRRWSHSPRN